MASLLLGPLLRYVGRTQATIWVETDGPCTVTAVGTSGRTFEVEGHHYALLVLDDLPEGAVVEYEVELDGERVWPSPSFADRPPSQIRTRQGEHQARLVFGSCRVGAPQREPYTLSPEQDPEGFGVDALWAYSRRLQSGIEPWPDCLLLLGDQVYADEVSPTDAASSFAPPRRRRSRRARRSPTSRSTRSSTGSPGAIPTSAGCSRPCRAR